MSHARSQRAPRKTAYVARGSFAIVGCVALALAPTLAGCTPPIAAPKDSPPTPLAAQFDPKDTGSIRGKVTWSGEVPKIEPIKLLIATTGFDNVQPNPNAPSIDPKSLGMADVLVFLRKVDPAHSRPWPHAPVEVAFDKGRLDIRQGERRGRLGIVRRGDEIACVASEKRNHVLEARGASVFSLPLLDPDKTTRRKLQQIGILELSSGSALYWLRGHLWIGDHPYAAATNAAGEFDFDRVPAGEYELVCWSPNWHIKRRERHSELGEIERLIFEDGVEQSSKIAVAPDETTAAGFRWRENDFAKRKP